MSKKTKKGVTMPLTNYLATEPKIVPVRESSWAAIVDEEDTKKSIRKLRFHVCRFLFFLNQ